VPFQFAALATSMSEEKEAKSVLSARLDSNVLKVISSINLRNSVIELYVVVVSN
jgi:hypothetical protein